MADCFLGEIRLFGGNYAPAGWAVCDGSPLQINQNDALYALLGTTYGGDGSNTFNLPDLRGRVPLHRGTGYNMGAMGGCETVALSLAQLPAHTHSFPVSGAAGTTGSPAGKVPAAGVTMYTSSTTGAVAMAAGAIGLVNGQGQAHPNMQPWLALNYIIALEGIFPTQD